MNECWIPVVNYEGLYEVDATGRVRGLIPSKKCPTSGHVLKPGRIGNGYLGVGLYKNKKAKKMSVHQIVMQAFIGPAPAGMNINHKDGNKKNNCLSNLEYVTFSDNSMHAFSSGILPLAPTLRGQSNGNASLTEPQAVEIAIRLHGGERTCDIAKEMGVSVNPVNDIKLRRKWKHLFEPTGPLAHLSSQQVGRPGGTLAQR